MSKAKLFTDIGELMTMKGALKKEARNIQDRDLSIVRNAVMVVEKGKILWVGTKAKLPRTYSKLKKVSCQGMNVFPGFVDCHTHLVFAGDRRHEFELRNQGVSYQEIARQGGGILSTVKATRRASLRELHQIAQERVNHFVSQGVTTVEVKSGYGLSAKDEIKMLRAAKTLGKARVVTTFLGAHAIPKEFSSEKDYLAAMLKVLEKVKKEKLSRRVDIFIEKGYFSASSARTYLKKAQELGFDITIHADQLSNSQATALAVELGALSADHVICLKAQEKKKIAQSETTAVLLPCADFYLQCDYPDARNLLDYGGRCALATDFNPGSSPTQSFSFLGLLARLNMKMTLSEVFVGMTLSGAYALGLEKSVGALLPGYSADFFVSPWSWKSFFYDQRPLPISQVRRESKLIHKSNASFN